MNPSIATVTRPRNLAALLNEGRPFDLGKPGIGVGAALTPVIDGLGCDISKMPTIFRQEWDFGGPLNDSAVNALYAATQDIFGAGSAPAGVTAVQSTGITTGGELQTYALICGVFYHVKPDPLQFVIPGNSFTRPASAQAGVVSPDVFTANDLSLSSSNNALGGTTATSHLPAYLNWGKWADEAAWHQAHAYNWIWAWGTHTVLMNVPLRMIMYVPPMQKGSAGQIDVDVQKYVRRVNNWYVNASPASASIFLAQNARRLGSLNSLAVAGASVFRPDRTFDRISAIYGGLAVRDLLCNNGEAFRLPAPYGVRPGVALGMKLITADNNALGLMQNELSISQGLGLPAGVGGNVPPSILPDSTINAGATKAGTSNLTFQEPSLDAVPVVLAQAINAERVYYKGGSMFNSIGGVGYEITEQQWRQVQDSGDAKSVLDNAYGCQLLS